MAFPFQKSGDGIMAKAYITHGANADMCPFCRDGTSAWLQYPVRRSLGRGFLQQSG